MVDAILEAGIAWVLWFQRFSPGLDNLMIAFTAPGEVIFHVALFPMLYWCVDRRLATRLAVLCLVSLHVNIWAKELLAQPRPWDYDPRVRQVLAAPGGGLPSGHTQNTVVVWGYLAARIRRPWLTALFVALIIVVPLSRIYLGAHFPHDLLGGYVLGALVLWLALRAEQPIAIRFARLALGLRLALAALVPLLILATMPPLHPRIMDGALLLGGAGLGAVLAGRLIRDAQGITLLQRVMRLAVGGLTSATLFLAIEALANAAGSHGVGRSILYAPLGAWMALGAPWLFERLGLGA